MGRCAECRECSPVSDPACVACVEELEAKLAGALGALEEITETELHPDEHGIRFKLSYADMVALARKALAEHNTPAAARLQAIEKVARVHEAQQRKHGHGDRNTCGCATCEAVLGEKLDAVPHSVEVVDGETRKVVKFRDVTGVHPDEIDAVREAMLEGLDKDRYRARENILFRIAKS